MMVKIVAGKHILESLSLGMYSNPLDILREYIQNSADSIDDAYDHGLLNNESGEIIFSINEKTRSISILDNGMGIPMANAVKKLSDIGNSDKDYNKSRGFRGIGRLGGLGYATSLFFITSAKGEAKRTVIKWDCIRLKQLLAPSNKEKEDIFEVIDDVMSFDYEDDDLQSHYFEVRLDGIKDDFKCLYTAENIDSYLADVAPVDFDSQKFPYSTEIKEHFAKKGHPIPNYKICHVRRNKPIYKLYTRSLSTGMHKQNRSKDYVKDVSFVYEETTDGNPLYIGWLAITDFSGQISDERLQGIRLRKGNILIGESTMFSRFFPSEGNVANKMFAGEIHILHPDIIPNTKRDDFEPGPVYQELFEKLSAWAESLNTTYRRGTSKISSAIRKLDNALAEQQELADKVNSGSISSDTKRDKFIEDLNRISKIIANSKKELDTAVRKGTVDPDRKETVLKKIKQADDSDKSVVQISNKVINADYATKSDLPTSYSRDEKKVYQRIIEVIDSFFIKDPNVAYNLREAIKTELSVKKK
ncbi:MULTISPECIES: ATP-binding protein [unclassified Dehalobacter]|uniref:ATP-binding protein n=1 Tax=unclassified Dehalobacter TaxID=2635733 RepID=UPI0010439FC0|nr:MULTISPECIES: ATP-binding protein [unclassified Dehalobacter]TCX50647.1 hypothetical protein C1I36_08845 [Dehalobacter sp. 14DCB1]TCX51217.1 hypothetical protein C1I38_10565 [Dehalobacter sp. 12DCB1]